MPVLLGLVALGIGVASASSAREQVLYSELSPVNTSECLEKVEKLPLR
jgi:hypothetical protein